MVNYGKIEELVGQTLVEVRSSAEEVTFRTDTGREYKLFHAQDCCEHVYLEDVCGDLADLIWSPIQQAEEVSNYTHPPKDKDAESYTWTFYKLATARGYVTLRWYGESNGYYSEEVSFVRLK